MLKTQQRKTRKNFVVPRTRNKIVACNVPCRAFRKKDHTRTLFYLFCFVGVSQFCTYIMYLSSPSTSADTACAGRINLVLEHVHFPEGQSVWRKVYKSFPAVVNNVLATLLKTQRGGGGGTIFRPERAVIVLQRTRD